MDTPTPQVQPQQKELSPQDGYLYLCEMVSEYLKTLPAPVRVPTSQAVNAASAAVGQALKERADLLTQMQAMQAEAKAPEGKLQGLGPVA